MIGILITLHANGTLEELAGAWPAWLAWARAR